VHGLVIFPLVPEVNDQPQEQEHCVRPCCLADHPGPSVKY
jgi:hypothetical protein